MTELPLTSILVPMRNEEAFITACLASLRAQDYPADRLEILVLDGESDDRSAEIVEGIGRDDPRVRLLSNPGRVQAAGLNLGIEHARGEIIVRADAHAIYGPTYVSTCVGHLLAGRAENVGGLQTATGTTPFGCAVAAALRTPLGAGNAPYRLATTVRYADTVWLGAWRRQTLRDLGGFDPAMVPNEDYELNCRLRERGGRILLDPTLPSTYYPRTSPERLWRQYFRYALAKIRCLRAHPDSLVLRQLAVPLAIGVILLSALLLPLTWIPFAVIGGGYVLGILLGSVLTAAQSSWRNLLFLPLIFTIIHFAWGIGFLWGVIRYHGFSLRLRGFARSERLVQRGESLDAAPDQAVDRSAS